MITTSRRKQTKPIRVYEDYGSILPPVTAPGEQYPYSNGSSAARDDSGTQDDDMPMDLHISIISCSRCPETFPTQDDLARHTAAIHTKPPSLEKPKEEDKGYPTAYHRLGREFQQETTFLNGHEDQTVPVSDMLPDPSQPDCKELLGVPVSKGDGSRIFHQDAFCELCEREFCNKYFLKTHKANKHGIYENSTSPFSMNSTSGSSPVSMVMPPEPPMQLPISLKVEQPLSKPILAFPKSEPKLSTTVKLEATKPEVPIQKPAPEIKREPVVNKVPNTSVITTAVVTTTTSSSSSSNNNNNNSASVPRLDMEDYCEICQKHFCNKYYLKKHKQDVHGIVPENPTTPQSGKRRHIPSSIAGLDGLPTMSAVSTSSQMILPPPVVNMGLPNMPLNMPGVMVLNPFMPPVAIISAQSLLPQQPGHSQPSAIISQPLPVCSVSEAPCITAASIITTSTSTSSPHDSSGNLEQQSKMLPSVTNDALRGIGVLNAEAYCELCRKEFCNKYFLKVHRANKHGIFSDDLCSSLPFGMSCEALDASMLAGVKMPLNMKMEPGSQPSPNAASNSESPVTFCNLCNTEFSSKYSYKIHRMNVHGMLNESLFDGSDLPMSATDLSGSEGLLKVAAEAHMAELKASGTGTSSAGDTSATTIFGNMIAAKLADRVICDICNKELTNKYFLKAHKLRVHGIDLSPQEKAAEAAAAAVFASGKQIPISASGMKIPVSTPKDQRDLSIITAEMITQDILQRSQTLNLSKKQHDLSHLTPESSTEKPSSDELVKLGIDPEAYCEICKKEFCSKYFLRTHKLNIHGIRSDKLDSEPATKVSMPYSSAPKNILPKSSSMGMSNIPNTVNNLTSSFHNSLLSSSLFSMAGFNPFGAQGGMPGFPGLPGFPGMPSLPGLNLTSSLFGNTHSISSSSSNSKLKDHLKESRSSKETSGNNCSKEGPAMSPVTTNSATSPVTSSASGSNINGNSSSKSKEGFERHTWRWKEPANSSRVSCEICNKELCNKYFLRTHKLNKHGIVPSVGSNSPAPSDTETASNASSSEKPDLGMPDKNGQTPSHTPKQDHSPLPSPGEDKSEKPSSLFKPTQLFKFKAEDDILNSRSYNSFAEICNICDRRFKNDHWLKAHIMKDHSGWPMMDMYKFGGSTPTIEGSVLGVPDPKTCQVCGLQFPSELSMQLHLIQEHNAQVTLKEDGDASASGDECPVTNFGYGLGFKKRVSRTDKLKMYVCLICNFKTRWISNLYEHEKTVHNVYKNTKLCPKSFPSKHVVNRHAENMHGDKPLDISSSGSRKVSQPIRRFRCVICGERFLSRAVCNKHLRQVHIRSLKDFSPPVKSKHSCSMCKFSTFYPQLLQHHTIRSHDQAQTQFKTVNHKHEQLDEFDDEEDDKLVVRKEIIVNNVSDAPVVQSFNLDVKKPDSIFLPAVAKMPVREKVDKVMAVTFVLTPVNP
ncbi:uncharacterized protein LOC121373972 [Gigantopelta aegis]|uniref:uncharacterized protein LOC121373972 n=1 Tax=Gigantopelta aegis TaxID=1735272 RepID=UPI001B88CF69|nr:uncharacterized protein LOC121373972 [Gigantopelta aegis]